MKAGIVTCPPLRLREDKLPVPVAQQAPEQDPNGPASIKKWHLPPVEAQGANRTWLLSETS
jgi:hypothetical protein